jgi:hypothetical protein
MIFIIYTYFALCSLYFYLINVAILVIIVILVVLVLFKVGADLYVKLYCCFFLIILLIFNILKILKIIFFLQVRGGLLRQALLLLLPSGLAHVGAPETPGRNVNEKNP